MLKIKQINTSHFLQLKEQIFFPFSHIMKKWEWGSNIIIAKQPNEETNVEVPTKGSIFWFNLKTISPTIELVKVQISKISYTIITVLLRERIIEVSSEAFDSMTCDGLYSFLTQVISASQLNLILLPMTQ